LKIDQVIARCRQGDTTAFDTLVSHYQARVYDLACSILRDETAAHDVVQDTFLKVYERLHTFQGQSAFETWLIAVATNCCRDHLRRRQVRQALSLDNLAPHWLRRLVGREERPEAHFESMQRRRSIWARVDKLDERLRLVLILRYRYDLSCGEIGEVLGIATTTVYDRLSEARRRLRQQMERDADNADFADLSSYQRHQR
jgi:RNA polymerase sigma-70 factor, ECF subfamily